jgi:hypothetical protein
MNTSEGNETVHLVVLILTNIETQLSQYSILAAVDDVSAVQATRTAVSRAYNDKAATLKLTGACCNADYYNDRLNIELTKARESLAQRLSAMLPAA